LRRGEVEVGAWVGFFGVFSPLVFTLPLEFSLPFVFSLPLAFSLPLVFPFSLLSACCLGIVECEEYAQPDVTGEKYDVVSTPFSRIFLYGVLV
jgi:hypothetical protein